MDALLRSCPRRDASYLSHSSLSHALCSLSSSELESVCGSSLDEHLDDPMFQCSRRIHLAKQVLAEASITFGTHTPITRARTAGRLPAGALGPLMSMLRECEDEDKLRSSLDTLSLLLMDASNRRIAQDLCVLDALLDLLARATLPALLLSTLTALHTLSKGELRDKMQLWAHPNKGSLLGLLSIRSHPEVAVHAMRVIRSLVFNPHRQLMEPSLLTAAAALLHPATDEVVVLKALKVLGQIACSPDAERMTSWHSVVFHLVPLLQLQLSSGGGTMAGVGGSRPSANVTPMSSGAIRQRQGEVVEASLRLLMTLAEHGTLRNTVAAAGCIPALLGLLHAYSGSHAGRWAACLLSELSEASVCCDSMCHRSVLMPMLEVLQRNRCIESTIAMLYALLRLCRHRSSVCFILKQAGAVITLQQLLQEVHDDDAVLASLALLEELTIPAVTITATITSAPPSAHNTSSDKGKGSVQAPARSSCSQLENGNSRALAIQEAERWASAASLAGFLTVRPDTSGFSNGFTAAGGFGSGGAYGSFSGLSCMAAGGAYGLVGATGNGSYLNCSYDGGAGSSGSFGSSSSSMSRQSSGLRKVASAMCCSTLADLPHPQVQPCDGCQKWQKRRSERAFLIE